MLVEKYRQLREEAATNSRSYEALNNKRSLISRVCKGSPAQQEKAVFWQGAIYNLVVKIWGMKVAGKPKRLLGFL